MIRDFGIVWSERALLLSGLANTAILSTLSAVAALLLGFIVTPALMSKRPVISGAARVFVDGMRCVPFLLFAYIIYYGLPSLGLRLDGLPSLGLRLDNWTSGLAALTIYNAAYMAEILRGAWVVQPREPIEAGVAFGFSGIRLFRRIILPPLLLSAGPVIGNQMIQIIKDSAFLTIIALPELTHAASSIQSRHYIPFAAFITAVFLYWGLCLVIEAGVSSIGRVAEARR
jgi:polar amino acid transport system permease protein